MLREDYTADNFVAGPAASRRCARARFLYIEEFNRAPEDTLNTLLTAIADRRIAVPRVGDRRGRAVVPGRRLDEPVRHDRHDAAVDERSSDRLCRLAVDYQDEAAERAIVALRTDLEQPQLVADAVAVTRATREHPDVRQGASVRGAIDVVLVVDASWPGCAATPTRTARPVLDAMIVALSGRIHLDEVVETTPEAVLREIWEDRTSCSSRRAAAPG